MRNTITAAAAVAAISADYTAADPSNVTDLQSAAGAVLDVVLTLVRRDVVALIRDCVR